MKRGRGVRRGAPVRGGPAAAREGPRRLAAEIEGGRHAPRRQTPQYDDITVVALRIAPEGRRTRVRACGPDSASCRRSASSALLAATSSTRSPPARWSSGPPPSSRNWSRTPSTPRPSRVEIALEDGGKQLDPRQRRRRAACPPTDLPLAFEPPRHQQDRQRGRPVSASTPSASAARRWPASPRSADAAPSRASATRARAPSIECHAGRVGEVRSLRRARGTHHRGARPLLQHARRGSSSCARTATELRHIVEAVTRLALPHPRTGVHAHAQRARRRCSLPRERDSAASA